MRSIACKIIAAVMLATGARAFNATPLMSFFGTSAAFSWTATGNYYSTNYTEGGTNFTAVIWTNGSGTFVPASYDAQVSEQRAAESAATAARAAKLKALRDMYAGATAQLCQLAGLPVVRVLDMADIQTAAMPMLATDQAGLVNGLLTLLTNLEGKLTREDMSDALNRV